MAYVKEKLIGLRRIEETDNLPEEKKQYETKKKIRVSKVKQNCQSKKRGKGALNHNTSKTIKQKKPKRGTTSAHTLIAPVKQNTHTGRERERLPTQCNGNKTETVTVLRPCIQAGRQQCVWCKREHQRACMGVHSYIQWAHYVCASWDGVRARVHARGHTQRVREGRVCVRAVHGSLSLTLTRPPPQQQPHTQQKEEEAKEGRWCERPRCCRHCFVRSSCQLCWRWRGAPFRFLQS
ncbi:hypothetical protein ECC02_007965 [Trypanosoma cruzi]|uniref:Uncharacterized protein n=1 Tax=Trypanosoma cruzi TaxID=5693 RepID=A0A7J6XYM7_TRYCR|nr:hypothetical protein ECC02_007965 [Trypanosoma cruzi]